MPQDDLSIYLDPFQRAHLRQQRKDIIESWKRRGKGNFTATQTGARKAAQDAYNAGIRNPGETFRDLRKK